MSGNGITFIRERLRSLPLINGFGFSQVQDEEVRVVFARYADGNNTKDFRKIVELCSMDITGFGSGPFENVKAKARQKEDIRLDLSRQNGYQPYSPEWKYGNEPGDPGDTRLYFSVVICGAELEMPGGLTAVLRYPVAGS